MTAICGGGTSSPQAGVGGVLSIGAAAIEVFISSVLALPEMAPILAPVIAGLVDIEIAAYCGTDPPPDPGLTADIVADAIAIPPSFTTFESQQKILQWFESRYWYQICQCNSVTTPAAPAPSNPGQVSSDPGLPTPVAPLCWQVTVPFSVGAASPLSNTQYTDMYATGLPTAEIIPISVVGGSPGFTANTVQVPNTLTHVTLNATLHEPIHATTGAPNVEVHLFGVGSTGIFPYSTINVLFGTTSTTTDPPRATLDSHVNSLALYVTGNDDIAHTGQISVSWQCPGGSTSSQPCCAPDPLLEGELQQILQYVQAIYAGLPIPPNSFAEGTAHSGLTGNGSITFAAVPIALKVTLTTIPPALGFEIGSPSFYFDVGYLSFGTSEGNYSQERLTLQQQLVQVPLLAGSAGYTLKNGVVATITELLPGP